MSFSIAEIALPVPLRKSFDYRIPQKFENFVVTGMRVQVSFGRQKKTGLVIKTKSVSDIDLEKLKPIDSCVDHQPIINPSLFKLISWVADYYHAPLGEVVKAALPGIYQPKSVDMQLLYQLDESLDQNLARKKLNNAPKQRQLFELLVSAKTPVDAEILNSLGSGARRTLNELIKKKFIKVTETQLSWPLYSDQIETSLPFSSDQQIAFDQLSTRLDQFNTNLLRGVTGSGKTEVYLQLAQIILDQNKQVLILVPEISLTPQLIGRFEQRLGFKAAVLHSALTEKNRRHAWQAAASGEAKIIIGTRSAVFAATANLGLIVLDEEHDMSYKQQEGVRYHARDVAIMRAKIENLPIVLGSATPSLESLANVKRGRFHLLELNQRIGEAIMPKIHLLAMDQLPIKSGLSTTLISAIERNLENKQQSLIYINRRGYAPVVLCKACGESFNCRRCNARLTYHDDQSLRCHHCGFEQKDDNKCGGCDSESLVRLGQGTQRIEATLNRIFPKANIARFDRDAVRKKEELESLLEDVSEEKIDILIGTQMLSKGHDFPLVTLVGVINSDNGLFGLDFHSTESMVQQLIQVSGRAGRGKDVGKVLIQTDFPGHPLYSHVQNHAYMDFADQELRLRQQSGFPPYRFLALIRASSMDELASIEFLKWIKYIGDKLINGNSKVALLDPVFSPMAKRGGRYRAQLLVSSGSRSARAGFLSQWIDLFENEKRARSVRWSIDVDPLDLY